MAISVVTRTEAAEEASAGPLTVRAAVDVVVGAELVVAGTVSGGAAGAATVVVVDVVATFFGAPSSSLSVQAARARQAVNKTDAAIRRSLAG
ncbi:MAG TPA: hypothetical protein VMZ51_04915 [Acidimicrobiales bacterium]|nr:hypothetical protein [Acidimicrobiales bacterium]